MDWTELQHDVSSWATRNFGRIEAWAPMLGLVEEVGEYYAAFNQVGDHTHRDEMRDALGDQSVYVLNLCEKVGLDFGRDIANGTDNLNRDIKPDELIGMLALSCRAVLKHSQGIRGYTYDKRREQLRLSLRGWYLWASREAVFKSLTCCSGGLLGITQQVWSEVRKRDWVKNPETANIGVPDVGSR